MRRARPLALAGALIPVIGRPAQTPLQRQRAGAALHWRKPAAARDYPALNLTIRPAFRFQFDLGMLRSEVQHFAQTEWQAMPRQAAVTGPRGAAGLRTAELHWLAPSQRIAAPATGAMRRTPAEFVAQARQRQAARIAEPPHSEAKQRPRAVMALPEWRATSAVRPEPPVARRAPHSPVLHWEQNSHLRRLGAAPPGAIAAGAVKPMHFSVPVAARRTTTRHTSHAPATRLPRADQIFAPASCRKTPASPLLTRSIALPPPRSAPSSQPSTRRPALDLQWQPRPEAPATTQDLATLARTLGAPEITRSVSASRSASIAHMPSAPAALPDTGRIVDEVISQIERRMRSDRLRRGL